MTYTYVKDQKDKVIEERQPHRFLHIVTPSLYKGHLGSGRDAHWKISDNVQVVNGVVEKADGTLLNGFFFNEIGDQVRSLNFILGSYPLYEVDIASIATHSKATAVLNLMTDEECR